MQRKFKLEKVLEYRNLVLEREKSKLGELVSTEQMLIEKVQQTSAEITLKQEELSTEQDFNLKAMYEKYIDSLHKKRRQQQMDLVEHRKLIAKQKELLVDVFRKKSVMDKLKEKHKIAYAAYADKEEAKVIEDIIITRKATEKPE